MQELIEIDRPNIFKFLDYRKYLSEYLLYLTSKNIKYSQRWLALKAGWKSPQLLTMILKGQRKLSSDHAQLLSMAIHLSEKEEEYLLVLVELENADNQDRQFEILDRIRFQFQNGLFKDLPSGGLDYLKQWYYSAIRELCVLKNFSVTPDHISQVLGISLPEAEHALNFLVENEYLTQNGTAYLRNEPSVKAEDYMSPLIMLQYHMQILQRAFQATQLSRDLRHFESLVVALPSQQMDLIREKIRQFIREVDMIGENSKRQDDVFQLSIQFFSLTAGKTRKEN